MIGLNASLAKEIIYYCCFCAVVFPGTDSVMAQQHHRFYYGTVTEEGTKRGLSGVNLFIEGTRIGTVSDKTGAFSFFTDTIPATLTVSFVGFESKSALLDETSFQLSLYLRRKAVELNEVEIKANLLEPFFKDDHYAVLDFDIDSNLVWTLVFRQRISKAELICKNLTGDTVAVSEQFTFKPVSIFRDCIGNLHILSSDSGFQIFRSGNMIQLIHPVKLKKFEDVLKNCVASTNEVLFFRKVTNHGLSVEYFGVNRKTMMQQTLAHVTDEEKLKMQRRNNDDAYLLMSARPPESRNDFVTWNYVHKILYRPVKAMLYQIRLYTCIFNNPEKQVEFYDQSGNFSYKLSLQIEKVNDGRWSQDIEIDKTSDKVYTTFLRNGVCTVYEINLNNGVLIKQLSLQHAFPEKVRIYNGWVYYLYDLSSDADNKMLFRQKLQ
ncbi:MAG: carboxypeptidase-like regulatory domain-containing protein [Bacteroidota bacterium]